MRYFIIFAAVALTGCSNLSEVRLGWDFAKNTLHVSVPLQKPTSSK
jgi:hypothetical protein